MYLLTQSLSHWLGATQGYLLTEGSWYLIQNFFSLRLFYQPKTKEFSLPSYLPLSCGNTYLYISQGDYYN